MGRKKVRFCHESGHIYCEVIVRTECIGTCKMLRISSGSGWACMVIGL